jgi:hypothetical protein
MQSDACAAALLTDEETMNETQIPKLIVAVREDPGYRAAIHILLALGGPRVWNHVRLCSGVPGGIDWVTMLAEGEWSGGERRLLQVAWSLFNGGDPDDGVALNSVFATLDDDHARVALEAMALYRGHSLAAYVAAS